MSLGRESGLWLNVRNLDFLGIYTVFPESCYLNLVDFNVFPGILDYADRMQMI